MAQDRVDLIVTALREQIANLSIENAIFRADITILTDEKNALLQEKVASEEAALSRDLEEKCKSD